MKTTKIILLTFSIILLGIASCSKDDNENAPKGQLRIEITDAPADDTKIEGVFVTITEIKIDGKSLEGFNKTTVDLMAYQNGNTMFLIENELEARTYNRITLVIDHERDANGNSPGCYVKDNNGGKHKLSSTSLEINMNKQIAVEPEMTTTVVIDFDLRKTIQRDQGGDSEYKFVASANLNGSVRVVNKADVGVIKGKCYHQASSSNIVIAYAYKKGSFNRNVEMQGSAQSNLKFHNAVTSSVVKSNGDYELHFLESGDYELHFASYSRNSVSGRLELSGSVLVNLLTAVDITSVNVRAETTTIVDVQATGVLPF
jgi:hypothetical protein